MALWLRLRTPLQGPDETPGLRPTVPHASWCNTPLPGKEKKNKSVTEAKAYWNSYKREETLLKKKSHTKDRDENTEQNEVKMKCWKDLAKIDEIKTKLQLMLNGIPEEENREVWTEQICKDTVLLVTQVCPTLCDLMDCSPPLWKSPAKNTGLGCHFLLQWIFWT